MNGVKVKFDDREFARMRRDRSSGVALYFRRAGSVVAASQRRRAAVDTGLMRDRIHIEEGWDHRGQHVDVGTDARTPDGKPYPLFVEFGTAPHDGHPGTSAQPFLRPSLFDMPRP